MLLLISSTKENFEDYGVMVPYERNYKYYGIKQEVHPLQLIGMLNMIRNKFKPNEEYKIEKPFPEDKTIYNSIKSWIISSISDIVRTVAEDNIREITDINELMDIQAKKTFRKIQNTNNFYIVHEDLIKYYESYDTSIKTYTFILKLHRKYSELAYSIYFDISYNTVGNHYHLNNFKIIGTLSEDKITLAKFNKEVNTDKCSLLQNKGNDCNTVISYDEDYNKKVNEFIENTKREAAITKEESLYKCFFKDALNEQECISHELRKVPGSTEVVKSPAGLWAKSKCTIDEECPFYKSNQNYPNSRGGCVDGKCEVPIGVNLVTPTMANPNDKPLCHNCNLTNCSGLECLKCCEIQRGDSSFNSPDYAFPNDINERLEHKDLFEQKGKSPFKLSL